MNLIHEYVIEEAKILLTTSNKTISEISYVLGFEYPNYFSRLFKYITAFLNVEFCVVNTGKQINSG